MVAIRRSGEKLVVGHLDPQEYPTQTFSLDPQQVNASSVHVISSTGRLFPTGCSLVQLSIRVGHLYTVRAMLCKAFEEEGSQPVEGMLYLS